MIRVGICDDESLVRRALADLLRRDPELNVVAEVGTGEAALSCLSRIDVWLMDIRLPGISGHETCAQLRQRNPSTNVLMVTAFPDGKVAAALQAGASGYVLKDDRPHRFREAVKAAAAGYQVGSRAVLAPVLAAQRGSVYEDIAKDSVDAQLINQIVAGEATAQMAEATQMSLSGVKKRIGRMMKRAGVETRPLLMAKIYAMQAVESMPMQGE